GRHLLPADAARPGEDRLPGAGADEKAGPAAAGRDPAGRRGDRVAGAAVRHGPPSPGAVRRPLRLMPGPVGSGLVRSGGRGSGRAGSAAHGRARLRPSRSPPARPAPRPPDRAAAAGSCMGGSFPSRRAPGAGERGRRCPPARGLAMQRLLWGSVVFTCLGLVALWVAPPRPRINRESFNRIQAGMTPTAVERIIGVPPGDYRTREGYFWVRA